MSYTPDTVSGHTGQPVRTDTLSLEERCPPAVSAAGSRLVVGLGEVTLEGISNPASITTGLRTALACASGLQPGQLDVHVWKNTAGPDGPSAESWSWIACAHLSQLEHSWQRS